MHSYRVEYRSNLFSMLLGIFLATGAFAQQPSPPTAPQGTPPASAATATQAPATTPETVIIKSGEQKVTLADFDALLALVGPQAQRANTGPARRQLAEQYGVMLTLAQQAEKDKLESSPTFQRQMAFARLQALARLEFETLQSQAKVTPEEVSQYYSAHTSDFEEVMLRQVVIRKRPEGAKEGSPGLPAADARTLAESFRKEAQGGKDWKDLAKDSKNPTDVRVDSEARSFRHGQLPAEWEKAAFQLKEGEISSPLENPQVIVMFQSAGSRKPELKEVSAQIESNLKQQKTESALDALKEKYGLWLDDKYFGASPTPPPGRH